MGGSGVRGYNAVSTSVWFLISFHRRRRRRQRRFLRRCLKTMSIRSPPSSEEEKQVPSSIESNFTKYLIF